MLLIFSAFFFYATAAFKQLLNHLYVFNSYHWLLSSLANENDFSSQSEIMPQLFCVNLISFLS